MPSTPAAGSAPVETPRQEKLKRKAEKLKRKAEELKRKAVMLKRKAERPSEGEEALIAQCTGDGEPGAEGVSGAALSTAAPAKIVNALLQNTKNTIGMYTCRTNFVGGGGARHI